jgi:hypothetical protein
MKQTAVEWLINELDLDNDSWNMKRINQAKEMEKQQAESIWKASDENMHRQFSSSAYKPITFEQYYNETFNK